MKPVWIAKLKREDVGQASEALIQTKENCFDPDVLDYPATEVLKAFSGDRNVMFVPIQTVFMPDALGFREDASISEKASALQSLFQVLAFESRAKGYGEIYMLCREESTVAFAERHGFERVKLPVFKMKLK